MSDPGPAQPAFTLSEIATLMGRAASLLRRSKGIEYEHAARALDLTVDQLRRRSRIGPPPPGVSNWQWFKMTAEEQFAMTEQLFDFYRWHRPWIDSRLDPNRGSPPGAEPDWLARGRAGAQGGGDREGTPE